MTPLISPTPLSARRRCCSTNPAAATRGTTCVHGPADVRSLRLHDDGGAEEGQVRLLPLHRLQGSLRQRVHPPGGTLSALGDDRRRHPDSRPTSRAASRKPFGRASRSPTWNAARRRNGSKNSAGRSSRSWIGATTTISRAGFPRTSGRENRSSGRRSDARSTPRSSAWRRPSSQMALTGQRILELAKQAGFLYRTQDPAQQRRIARNGAFELHVRSRNSLSCLR